MKNDFSNMRSRFFVSKRKLNFEKGVKKASEFNDIYVKMFLYFMNIIDKKGAKWS